MTQDNIVKVLTLAVLVLVFLRQFRASRLNLLAWVLPIVPALLGVFQPGFLGQQSTTSIGLGVAIIAVGAVLGVVYGILLKVWKDEKSHIWLKGGWVGLPIWAGLVISRQAYEALGSSMHAPTNFGFAAISFALMLFVRVIVVAVRAPSSRQSYAAVAAG
jgi:hypothetical protein